MPKVEKEKQASKARTSDRFLAVMSRFIVSLTWAILLAVIIFVVYLVTQFSQG
jgi:hypothetical protein